MRGLFSFLSASGGPYVVRWIGAVGLHKIYSSVTGIAQGRVSLFADYEDEGEMWAGEGPRSCVIAVEFDEKFKLPPSVEVNLSMLDSAEWTNQRFDLSVQNITETGFEILFKTWGDTKIARAAATWMAIGDAYGEGDWQV